MVTWSRNVEDIAKALTAMSATKNDGKPLSIASAFAFWTEWTIKIRKEKRTVFLIGNGASASMASHVAADLAKNAHVRTEVFTDLALITAIANDLSFNDIFSEPLKRRLAHGDMLVAISSSGQSPNILQAARTTRECGGIVVTLSAMKHDNPLFTLGDLNFYIPGHTYGMAETCHAALLHYWIDKIVSENNLHPEATL
ncbi:MAG: Phosphoheptose isomerase [Syntrophus sp. SKADARSKE-3]|nr:Phosphoheptose isomerase [Syntrophus sp. SKADARSKE-3]